MDIEPFSGRIVKLDDFGERLNESNFIESIEYKYLFNREKPEISAIRAEYYGLRLKYKNKEFTFVRKATCNHKNSFSKTVDLSFFEDLGSAISGGKVKDKILHYDVYKCLAQPDWLLKIASLEKAITSDTLHTDTIKNKRQWEITKFTGKTFNEFIGSNNGVDMINPLDSGSSWGVICNNGASGMVTLDNSIYCASGANKHPKCKHNIGVHSSAAYLCQ